MTDCIHLQQPNRKPSRRNTCTAYNTYVQSVTDDASQRVKSGR